MPDIHIPIPSRPGLRKARSRQWLFVAMLLSLAGLFIINSPAKERIWPQAEVQEQQPTPPTALHPVVAAKTAELVKLASKAGIAILITDGYRSSQQQDTLYKQGRSAKGQVVTNAKGGDSYHNYGLAVDFALRTPDGDVIWDLNYDGNHNGQADWMEVVAIAKSLGFAWGGDWKGFKDYPHLQMDFGYSIKQLKRGLRPLDDANP